MFERNTNWNWISQETLDWKAQAVLSTRTIIVFNFYTSVTTPNIWWSDLYRDFDGVKDYNRTNENTAIEVFGFARDILSTFIINKQPEILINIFLPDLNKIFNKLTDYISIDTGYIKKSSYNNDKLLSAIKNEPFVRIEMLKPITEINN